MLIFDVEMVRKMFQTIIEALGIEVASAVVVSLSSK